MSAKVMLLHCLHLHKNYQMLLPQAEAKIAFTNFLLKKLNHYLTNFFLLAKYSSCFPNQHFLVNSYFNFYFSLFMTL